MASNILGALYLIIKTKGDTSGLDKTDKAIKKTTTSLQKMSKSTGMLGTLGKRLAGGFSIAGLAYGFNRYLQFEKDLGAIHSRFFAITKDEQKAVEEFNYIRKVAKDTANDIKAVADSYSIFYSSTSKTLGKEGARQVFEDWTQVGRVLHLSESQMERVTYALREMSSKGAIYSQDLRMQIGTHVPNAMGLAQQAAEEMGFTGTQWFENLQKAAKGNMQITTQFVKLFSKYAKQSFATPEALQKALQQPDALATMIKNLRTEFGIKISEAGGKNMVIGILRGIYNTLDSMPIDAIANILGKTGYAIGEIAKYMPEIVNILKDIAIIYLGRMLTRGIGGLFNKISKSALFVNLKYLFRDGIKAGFSNIGKGLLLSFKNIIAKAGIVGIKGILSRVALRFLPFIGQALLFFDIVKGIWHIIKSRFGSKDDKDMFTTYGVTPTQVSTILNKVSQNPHTLIDPIELQKQIGYYQGGQGIAGHAYIDNGQIVLNFNGTILTQEDINKMAKEGISQLDKNKKEINNKYFHKPTEGVKNLRGW